MTDIVISNETVTFKSLTSMVKKDDDFKAFELDSVKIEGSEDDMIMLSKAIRGHPCMKTFMLKNVTVANESVDLDQVVEMLLITCPKLRTLHLENAPISATSIATAGYCSTLEELLVPNSKLNDKDAATVAAAVAQNQSVRVVDLTGNDMTDVGCLSFSKALEKNLSLQTLKLDGNGDISSENRNKIAGQLSERIAKAA